MQARKPHRMLGSADDDARPGRKIVRAAAVAPQHAATVGALEQLHRQGGFGADAVEPVGVDTTMPSQPNDDSGRPSISITTSSIRSRLAFSTVASFSAHVS